MTREWEETLTRQLLDAGLRRVEADRLTRDAVEEAQDAGCDPQELYGPAVAYASTLIRTLHVAETQTLTCRQGRRGGEVVLRLRSVSKKYGKREVLRDVDLELRSGEIAAVVGANGSGKSTLLGICAGLIRPSSGAVQRSGRIGYAPQLAGVAPLLTPDEHFRLFGAASRMGARKARATGRRLASLLGWQPHRRIVASRLSGGTQQKLNVVLAELDSPDLILLDEPCQGFDEDSYVIFRNQLLRWRDRGAGILMITHMLRDLGDVDHIIELHPRENL